THQRVQRRQPVTQTREPEALDDMTALVLATLLCMGLALAVVALVAVPARREGRDLLTARGEEVVGALRERSDQVRPRRAREAAHG
ncbi:hypothetical protein, partial [Phycicoccus sp.]|uniref:hypothetical protein n=4 Tax=Intrasporangiaceae TaxID=85021 RepID=UPI002CCEC995